MNGSVGGTASKERDHEAMATVRVRHEGGQEQCGGMETRLTSQGMNE